MREEGEGGEGERRGGTFITQYGSTVYIGMSMGGLCIIAIQGNSFSICCQGVEKGNCKPKMITRCSLLDTGKNMIFSELSMTKKQNSLTI